MDSDPETVPGACSPPELLSMIADVAVLQWNAPESNSGSKVVEYELWTPRWTQQKQAGKWKDFPKYGMARKGRIGLQDHGNKVYFRNIKIRPLPTTK